MTQEAERVLIVLAVRNGAAHLRAQLQSFAAQDFSRWDLLAGDDGSTDDSPAQLAAFAKEMQPQGHAVRIVPGPQIGGAAHFISLLQQAPEATRWLAFSDQDDVWVPEKLDRAISSLETASDDQPSLYCSRTWVTDADLNNPVLSRPWPRAFGFRNALVQNVAAGNTIVLNRAAIALAQRAAPAALAVPDLPAHDWWLYQIVTGAGGQVLHDDQPGLYYRQHGTNQIGANHGIKAGAARAAAIFSGVYARWNAANIAALTGAGTLTPENQARLERFAALRARPTLARLSALHRLGLYRQTPLTQAALWLAAALNKI